MKKLIFFCWFLTFTILVQSQQKFDKGYVIDNDGVKTECLIRFNDSKQNPSNVRYKLTVDSEIVLKEINQISEFGIYGFARFIRSQVKIDNSSVDYSNLSTSRNPEWRDSLVFLKVLVDGNARLFSYSDGINTLFFYSLYNAPIEQLIYKIFLINDVLRTNNGFKQQLQLSMRNKNITEKEINVLSYAHSDLIKLFTKFNNSGENPEMALKYEREVLNFKLTPAFELLNLNTWNPYVPHRDANFYLRPAYRLGFETEVFLPLYKNKVSLLLEPVFQYANPKTSNERYELIHFKYALIDIPIGVRYYHYFDKFRLFANAHFVSSLGFNFDNKLIFYNENQMYNQHPNIEYEVKPSPHFAAGIGGGNNKLSIELRYNSSRDIFFNYQLFHSDLTKFSFVFGYKFVEIRK
jgi:hypothetical protein